LNDGFVFVTQSGPGGFSSLEEVGSVIHSTMKQVFKHTILYAASVSSFFDNWCFNLAYDDNKEVDPRKQNAEEINKLLSSRLNSEQLKFYDGDCHRHIFGLPKCITNILQKEKRIITEKTPVFMNAEYEQATGEFVEN